jgi:hypothetical protein
MYDNVRRRGTFEMCPIQNVLSFSVVMQDVANSS